MAGAREATQLPGIQILRAVAALAVLVHHVLEESQPVLAASGVPRALVLFGAVGVDLFFVISGFIMLHTNWEHFGRPSAPKRFLGKRVLRIMPLYWFCVIVVLGLWSSSYFYRSLEVTTGTLLGSLTLVPTSGLIVGVAWTLIFEMYFYYLFALWLYAPRPEYALVGLPACLAIASAGAALLPFGTLRAYLTNPIVYEFCFGLWLAGLHRSGRAPAIPLTSMIVGIAVALLAAVLVPSKETAGLQDQVRFLAWGVPAALIVHWASSVTTVRSHLARWLCQVGDASYALYLTHGFVMIAYAYLLKHGKIPLALFAAPAIIIVIAAAISLGVAAHLFIERPLSKAVLGAARIYWSAQRCFANSPKAG